MAVPLLTFALFSQPALTPAADRNQKPPAPPSASPTSLLNMPGPEAQNLMLGTWAIRVKYEPSPERPKGGAGVGSEVWRPGPGGRSVIEEFEVKGDAGELHGLGIAWWDEEEKGQLVLWCSSDNPDGCHHTRSVARWEGNSLVYTEESEEKGKKVVIRETFTDITPISFTQILKSGPTAAELKTTITIHATRVTGPTPDMGR